MILEAVDVQVKAEKRRSKTAASRMRLTRRSCPTL